MLKYLEGSIPVLKSFSGSSVGKESACSAGNLDLIPRSGRSTEEGNGNPLQYSCLENPMDRGAWQVTAHVVARIGYNSATKGFPGGASGKKNLPANAGDIRDAGSKPGLGISPGGGNGNPLQYSCLENPMDRGA